MWESIVSIIKSDQWWIALIVAGLIVFAIRQGYMKVRTEKILIGRDSSEKERLLMKKQTEYAHNACIAFEKEFPRFDGYNATLGELIAEKAYDEVVNWIMVNHIEDKEDYISNKQTSIWNIVTSELVNEKMRSKKNKEMVFNKVEELVKELVKIRSNNEDMK